MEEITRIYSLLLRCGGLKIRLIAEKLELDALHVAEIMFSPDCIPYWYQNEDSIWFAKEGAIQEEELEPEEDKLTSLLEEPRLFKIEKYSDAIKSESVISYLSSLNRYRTYTNKEVIELFDRYRNGDKKAYDAIVKGNLKLVAHIAYFYSNRGASFEDLIQEGNIGLLKAIERFDYTIALSFNNFAKSWILQSILLALSDLPYLVGLPLNQLNLYNRIQKFSRKFEQEQGYKPSVNQIKLDEDINPERLYFLCQLPDDLTDICINDELDNYESELFPADAILNYNDLAYSIDWHLSRIPNRGKDIIRMRFGIGCREMTLDEIGDKFGLTRERVRQIYEASIRKLREYKGKKLKNIIQEPPSYPIKDIDDSVEPKRIKYKASATNNKAKNTTVHKNKVHPITEIKSITKKVIYGTTIQPNEPKKEVVEIPKVTIEQNDYDKLSQRLKMVTTNRNSTPSHSYDTKPDRTNNVAPPQPQNKTVYVISGKKESQNVTEYMGIRVGDYITYSNKVYTVNCTVLKIHEQTKRIVVRYKNGVIDNLSLVKENIRIISRGNEKEKDLNKDDFKPTKKKNISFENIVLKKETKKRGVATSEYNSKKEWFDKSIAVKWIKYKMSNDVVTRKEIVQQFNYYHRLGYEEFSSREGKTISEALLSLWIRYFVDTEPDKWTNFNGHILYSGEDLNTIKRIVDDYLRTTPNKKS